MKKNNKQIKAFFPMTLPSRKVSRRPRVYPFSVTGERVCKVMRYSSITSAPQAAHSQGEQ